MIGVWLAMAALLGAGLAALAARALRDLSKHELERVAKVLGIPRVAAEVQDRQDDVALVADTLAALLVTVFALLLATSMAAHGWLSAAGWPLGVAASLAAVVAALALTVWLPSAVTPIWAAPFLLRTWGLWRLLVAVLAPCLALARGFAWLATRLSGQSPTAQTEESLEEEIRTIVTEGQREGLLEEEAREMIESVIEMGDATVGDIMTPRTDMNTIQLGISLREAAAAVVEAGHSRIPVYDKSRDDIVGILYSKDLLAELIKPDEEQAPLAALVRPPVFVPETKPVVDLLEEFQKSRNHMAIVLNEFGGMAGLVTIEDALEEIVGEIVDEHDEAFVEGIKRIDDRTSEVSARMSIEELNERLGLTLPESGDFDTVGGFVFNEMGHLPSPGEQVQWRNIRFTVLDISRRRIEKLRVEVLAPVPSEPVSEESR